MNTIAPDLNKSETNIGNTWNIRSRQAALLYHYIFHTLPQVQKKLKHWKNEAARCIDEELRTQALASIATKDFHCQGGAVFATPYATRETVLVDLIAAYQTLCDYLDNLCDRASCTDGEAFREVHESLLDALTPGAQVHDYYRIYPNKNDNGYIQKLVSQCRRCLERLPSYQYVYEDVIYLARLYIDLQVLKHIGWDKRETSLKNWADNHLTTYPGILWQEFAAATGSTLAIFALFGLAARSDISSDQSREVVKTYFPWICGLHILLDYFIDQEEDRQGGDLNFTFYYPDNVVMIDRLKIFIREAHEQSCSLTAPAFEKTVIEGLLAMYLSDAKIKKQGFKEMARELINESGSDTMNTYRLCRLVRKFL